MKKLSLAAVLLISLVLSLFSVDAFAGSKWNVSGAVKNYDGTPAAGFTVQIFQNKSDKMRSVIVGSGLTDAAGRYTVGYAPFGKGKKAVTLLVRVLDKNRMQVYENKPVTNVKNGRIIDMTLLPTAGIRQTIH
jgi:hypothetical protein